MGVITVYVRGVKHVLQEVARLVNRANQALQTLERYKTRLDEVTAVLSTLEVEDIVTLRDVTSVLQRTEMVRRIAQEIDGYIVELGTDARLIQLQLDELLHDAEDDRSLVVHDYAGDSEDSVQMALDALSELSNDELLDLRVVSATLRLGPDIDPDRQLQPRGYRLLTKVPRLTDQVVDDVVGRFGSLQKIMRATLNDLEDVDGVGEARARAIKEGLSRLAETSILDRYS
jgi:diadenylate cyclase